ncbi:hypothetical protein OIDMADRAFT_36049 [Oidiodendron maius Zn]|uniref:Uncharacterized protein n=1 Tax=Oidiodendron maius (strain Zn) TaxID=913774 RepID=A0A0C3GRQ5_OIDMZ|nr:hypothetical protein OIDMADRAFT_36049 [Oidiodendron maius Zn]
MSASFNGVDIYIITDKQTGYRFDVNLKLKDELPLAGLIKPVVCHGFHSNRLTCGHATSITVIDTRRSALLRNIQLGPRDTVSDLSTSEKFIAAGTIDGKVYLFDSMRNRLNFTAGGYVHSVSIHRSMILAATSTRIYIWSLSKSGQPLGLKCYNINPDDDILWACFNPFECRTGSIPFLLGRSSQHSTWERDFRPMIKRRYSLVRRELILSVTGKSEKKLNIRGLPSKQIIQSIPLEGEPQMLWSDHRNLFVVYLGSSMVETMKIRHYGFPAACFESVSLLLADGP